GQFHHNPFFNCIGTHKPMRQHRSFLTKPMCTRNCLILNRRIPPAVKQEHMIRRLKIQALAASFVLEQQYARPEIIVERFDDPESPWHRNFARYYIDAICTVRMFPKALGQLIETEWTFDEGCEH